MDTHTLDDDDDDKKGSEAPEGDPKGDGEGDPFQTSCRY